MKLKEFSQEFEKQLTGFELALFRYLREKEQREAAAAEDGGANA